MRALKLTPMRWFGVLVVVAFVLVLALPPDPQSLRLYHLSDLSYRIILIFLLLPYAAIWYAVFYAFAKLLEYTHYLNKAKEEKAFQKITLGMGILAFGLLVPTIISSILNEIAVHHHGFKPAAVIINNYMSLLVAIAAFSYMGSGARMLVQTVRSRATLNHARLFGIIFIVLGVFFTRSVIHNHNATNGWNDPYHLSLYPLMITIIIPYLYAWFIGMICAYDLKLYSSGVKGLLYKKAFSQLSAGVAVTILSSIAIQFITSAFGGRTDKSLTFILLLIYVFIVILLVGLGLLALGTQKLKKIEEV
jgi:drug/metabolite transporter (DMT)-like permease